MATSYIYDGAGRLSHVSAGSRTWGYDYDAAGWLLNVTDPAAPVDSFLDDSADRPIRQVFPDGHEVQFAYDSSGNLTSVTPPSRPPHWFTYTAIDPTQSYDPPDLGAGEESTTYGYNLDRQLTSITRPDGQVLNFVYDTTTGRLDRLTIPGGDVAGSVSVSYDDDFRVAKTYINGADSVAYAYDADGLLVAAGSLSVRRDPANGLVTADTLGRVSTAPRYNGFGEWSAYVARLDSTDLFSTSYTRDELGRITQLVETIQGQTKTYDCAYDAAGDPG